MASKRHTRPRAGSLHRSLLVVVALGVPSFSTAGDAVAADLPPQERLPIVPRTASDSAGPNSAPDRRPATESADPPELLAARERTPGRKPSPVAAGPASPLAPNAPASIVAPVETTGPAAPPKDSTPPPAGGIGSGPARPPDGATTERGMLPEWLSGDTILHGVIPIGALALTAIALRAILGRGIARAARPSGVVEILARYPVGRGQHVALLRVGRRVIVVHQSDRSMTTLCETADADEAAELIARSREGARDSFSRLLARRRAADDPFDGVETIDLTKQGRALRPATAPRAGGSAMETAIDRPVRERTLPFAELRG